MDNYKYKQQMIKEAKMTDKSKNFSQNEKKKILKHEKELSFYKRYKKIFYICLIMVPERSTFHAIGECVTGNIQRNNFKRLFSQNS